MTTRLDILLLRALCLLLLAVTAGSCSQIYDPEGPCEDEYEHGDMVSLKFKIYTDGDKIPSRALGVWEEDPANVAERILDPEDMRVLILNADGHLVKSVKPAALEYNKSGDGIFGDGHYELTAIFQDESFDNYFKRNGDDAKINFRVMILANINSIGGIYTTDAMMPGTLFEKLQETFTMSPGWFPSDTQGIPMFGYLNNISANKAELTQVDGLNLDRPISMLRALCKVEVSDVVVNAKLAADGKKYPCVTGVEMISWRDDGYLRPQYFVYESSGGLTSAYIPNASAPATTTPVKATYIDGVYRFYCPEARLAEMRFRVKAVLAPGGEEKSYEVSLAQYAGSTEFGSDMVRNHIYRFEVESFNTIADLKLTVAAWGQQIDEYTLDDIVVMDQDGFLTWTNVDGNPNFAISTEPYNGKDEMWLSMLNGTTDYATGTFHISSPEGAVWRATFIPGENGIDAFEFVDVDADGKVIAGSEKSFVEGAVGERATIHIRGKGEADNYRHTAELVVEVRQPDGTVLYAPIAWAGSSRYIIYREDKL